MTHAAEEIIFSWGKRSTFFQPRRVTTAKRATPDRGSTTPAPTPPHPSPRRPPFLSVNPRGFLNTRETPNPAWGHAAPPRPTAQDEAAAVPRRTQPSPAAPSRPTRRQAGRTDRDSGRGRRDPRRRTREAARPRAARQAPMEASRRRRRHLRLLSTGAEALEVPVARTAGRQNRRPALPDKRRANTHLPLTATGPSMEAAGALDNSSGGKQPPPSACRFAPLAWWWGAQPRVEFMGPP